MGLHVGFKLNMTRCAKVHGNQVGKRNFGPCPTKKVICVGRRQSVTGVGEEQMFFVCVLWNGLTKKLRWKTGWWTRISLSTKMVFCVVRGWAVACCATDCGWRVCWCYRFMKRHALIICSETTVVQNIPAEYKKIFFSFRNSWLLLGRNHVLWIWA